MSAPDRVTLWVCPSGRHVFFDQSVPLSITGCLACEDDGSRTPLCYGHVRCGDRRCERIEYVSAIVRSSERNA